MAFVLGLKYLSLPIMLYEGAPGLTAVNLSARLTGEGQSGRLHRPDTTMLNWATTIWSIGSACFVVVC
jgi:hypothetical protein